jgi:hypothetical protein
MSILAAGVDLDLRRGFARQSAQVTPVTAVTQDLNGSWQPHETSFRQQRAQRDGTRISPKTQKVPAADHHKTFRLLYIVSRFDRR